jgi:serine phosphatase RsbU (regulator of sigma subunit)
MRNNPVRKGGAMFGYSLADSLLIELLTVSIILMLQMLYNNIVVFKRKISDNLSVMLIFCIAMTVFDHIWTVNDGRPGAYVINYIGAIGYALSEFIVMQRINRYFLEKLDIKIRSSRVFFLLYHLPLIIIFLLLISTPWAGFIFKTDANNVIIYMPCYYYVFRVLLYLYPVAAMIICIYMWLFKYKTNNEAYKVARSMIIFVVTAVGMYHFQEFILVSITEAYMSMPIALSVPLVLMTTDLNVLSLLKEEKKNAAVGADLETACRIQMDALPINLPAYPAHPNVSLTTYIKTAKEVGGDFYDYFTVDENHVCFLIADVSGKGIPAALFMMTVKTMIKDHAMSSRDTSEIFTTVNRLICESNKSGMFATAWIGIIDTAEMTLQYTNAAHNYPLFAPCGGSYDIIKTKHGLFLAGMNDTIYGYSEIKLNTGDRLLLYTDGITEAHNTNGELYGKERLKEVLGRQKGRFTKDNMENIIADVDKFVGDEPQFDDMTMVMVEIVTI